MSRLTSKEVKNMMEAYSAVYAPQELTEEQIWEEVENWVNSLLEEGYDLSDYTWEEMYESYIEEQGGQRGSGSSASQTNQSVSGSQISSGLRSAGNVLAYGNPQGTRPTTQSRQTNVRGGGTTKPAAAPSAAPTQSRFAGARDAAFARAQNIKGSPVVGPKPTGAPAAAARPSAAAPAASAAATARPAAGAPAASATAKPAPAAPAGQTGDKAKDMATFAKANPKLAAASAERERTRGTSATTNPLMKDFKSRLPAPSTPAPSTAAKGFDLASKGVDLSKSSSPTTPAATPAPAAAKPTPAATPAPAPKPTPAATGSKKPGSIVSHYDPFDVVIGHLLDEGYADTEESALAIMANMSEEWRNSIVEGVGGYDDPVLGPQTPLGKAARTAGRVIRGAAQGAVAGAQGAMKPSTAKPLPASK